MNHECYIFGSMIRGEITSNSDLDVLVIPLEHTKKNSYPLGWSCYSEEVIKEMYKEGDLFAWHLHLESICVYSPKKSPLLLEIGKPEPYRRSLKDIEELNIILTSALTSLNYSTVNIIYEIGIIHTCLRNIAMAASSILCKNPCFSINAPFEIKIAPPLDKLLYMQTAQARHYSTRGISVIYDWEKLSEKILKSPINEWVSKIKKAIT